MKRLFFLSLLLLMITATARAQVIVYDTYNDYVNNTGRRFDKYDGYLHFMGRYRLHLIRKDEHTSIKCKDIWGFQAGGNLFRTTAKAPLRVESFGRICYYVNGIQDLNRLLGYELYGHQSAVFKSYVSVGKNDKIYYFPKHHIPAALKRMRKEHPEYAELFHCMKGARSGTRWNCVRDFEKKMKEATPNTQNTVTLHL